MLFAWMDDIQVENAIVGDVFEIGAHHGRSSIFLGEMAGANGQALGVCDLFGQQESNLSASGSGDRGVFDANMSRLIASGLQLKVYEQLSESLSPSRAGRNHRFFHVDGGHNPEEALQDLELAAACIIDQGLIALDDPFRPEWPGVTEGVIRFLDAHPELHAFAVGFNKLLIAKDDIAKRYQAALADGDKRSAYGIDNPWQVKMLPFVGKQLAIFFKPSWVKEDRLTLFRRLITGK